MPFVYVCRACHDGLIRLHGDIELRGCGPMTLFKCPLCGNGKIVYSANIPDCVNEKGTEK